MRPRSVRTQKQTVADKRECGGYAPMAYLVLRSEAFGKLSPYAVKLLMDLVSQYKGDNNGDLCATWKLMKKRGWRSPSTLNNAKRELEKGGWVIVARQGSRNNIPTLYAVTFFSIDECKGKLDIDSTHSPPGNWRKYELPLSTLTKKIRSPSTGGVPAGT